MSPETTLLIGLASGIFALVGALGSQIITAYANLKAKRIELVYTRKVDAYKDLIQKCFAWSNDIGNNQRMVEFHQSILIASTVASDKVLGKLSFQNGGMLHIAKELFSGIEKGDKHVLAKNEQALFARMEEITDLIREDLRKFSGK